MNDVDCHKGSVSRGVSLVLLISTLCLSCFLSLSITSHINLLCIETFSLQNKRFIFEIMIPFETRACTLHVIIIVSHDSRLNFFWGSDIKYCRQPQSFKCGERFSHPYKECFVPLSNRHEISQSTSLGEAHRPMSNSNTIIL